MNKDEFVLIKDKAIKLLAKREYAYFELEKKLLLYNYNQNNIKLVLTWLKKNNLQSDDRFTEYFFKEKMLRGYGPILITHQLENFNISSCITNKYLILSDETWINIIDKFYKKLFLNNDLDFYSNKFKIFSFFERRGFTNDQINSFFNTIRTCVK